MVLRTAERSVTAVAVVAAALTRYLGAVDAACDGERRVVVVQSSNDSALTRYRNRRGFALRWLQRFACTRSQQRTV